MREELQWKEIEERNCAVKWGGWLDTEESSEGDWPVVPSNAVWPELEVGVEVSVEVRSEVGDLVKGNSACRSLVIIGCLSASDILSLLCHRTVGTSFRSCSPTDRSH
jgi:hypothetical protein